MLTRLPRHRLLRLFPSIYQGNHIGYREVITRKAKHIVIRTPRAMLLGPDGEFKGRTPAEITCLQRDLEIFY